MLLQYLVLTLGDAKEATPTINKTLNPEWNQTLEFPIAGQQSLLLEACCWDKDRFGKDYMGEFDVIVEDVFQSGSPTQEPRWYPLESRRTGKKKAVVTGEILLQFSLIDPTNPSAAPEQIMSKFLSLTASSPSPDEEDDETLLREDTGENDDQDEEETESSDEAQDESGKAEKSEKRRRRLRLAKLKRKAKQRAYEFTDKTEVAGVLFLEIQKITDLPPERNSKLAYVIAQLPLTQYSDQDIVRHGPLRCHILRQENVSHKSHQSQPQPGVRREARFPGFATRDELFYELYCHGQGQVFRKRLYWHGQLPA